jgi:P4 family phage/plasmid primase-like protien
MRDPCAEDYCTKITAVAPDAKCSITLWLAFLDRVTDGNRELQAYLQRLIGYALTGVTKEHALAFLYGLGANGKGVFVGTIAGILGGYHRAAPIETFTASSGDRHPTELAMLQGARLVTAQETEEGRRWAESKILAHEPCSDAIAAGFLDRPMTGVADFHGLTAARRRSSASIFNGKPFRKHLAKFGLRIGLRPFPAKLLGYPPVTA